MIAPDPDVLDLLEEFAVAGVPGLATAARDAAILPDDDDDEGLEPVPSSERSREDQLERASRFIRDTISREIAMTKRIAELASELDLKDVVVTSVSTSEHPVESASESLTARARIAALDALGTAWTLAEGELTQAWRSDDEQ